MTIIIVPLGRCFAYIIISDITTEIDQYFPNTTPTLHLYSFYFAPFLLLYGFVVCFRICILRVIIWKSNRFNGGYSNTFFFMHRTQTNNQHPFLHWISN